MKNKGFLSTFYFGYLLCTVTMIGIIEHQLQLRVQTILNMRQLTEFMDQQIAIIDFVKCKLNQVNSIDGQYQVNDFMIHAETSRDEILVVVEGEYSFKMIIIVNEQQEITNYYLKLGRDRE